MALTTTMTNLGYFYSTVLKKIKGIVSSKHIIKSIFLLTDLTLLYCKK